MTSNLGRGGKARLRQSLAISLADVSLRWLKSSAVAGDANSLARLPIPSGMGMFWDYPGVKRGWGRGEGWLGYHTWPIASMFTPEMWHRMDGWMDGWMDGGGTSSTY